MADNLTKWRQLPEIKQKAVRMRAEGTTMDAISAELSVPPRTVEDWFCGPSLLGEELEEFKAHLADQQIQSLEDFQNTIRKDAERIWNRLVQLAEGKDSRGEINVLIPSHVVLGAVDSVLDRIGIARVSKTEGKTTLTLTDEDRRKRFEAIKELQADLEPVQLKRLAGGAG